MNSEVLLFAPIIIVFIILVFFYNIYVALIKSKNKAQEAYSGISVQLKKRYDLIPNILQIANKFMEHERGIMEEITKLRTAAQKLGDDISNSAKKFELDKEIRSKMAQIMVAVENYPQLKSDSTMVAAMQTYNEVEEHIAAARRFYNSAVLELNNRVEIFPSSMVAAMINVKKQEFFQIDANETAPINASQYLK